MHCTERIRPFAFVLLGVAVGVGSFRALTASEEPEWARARHADELGSPLFTNVLEDAPTTYVGADLPEPDWSRADFLRLQDVEVIGADPLPVDTPVGPLTSTGDGGQGHQGATCSAQVAHDAAAEGGCSTDGRGAGGSPQSENCSATGGTGGSGKATCSAGGMGPADTKHCSAGGTGPGKGDSAACSTGGLYKSPVPGGTCSAAATEGGGAVDCSTYGSKGEEGGGSSHMSCSVGNSHNGSCSAKAGGEGSGSAFCSASGTSDGEYGNKCSVNGYPGGGSGSGQSCSVLTKAAGGGATCSVKAGSNGACTTIGEGTSPEGMGSCSAGNTGTGAEETIVCSVIGEDGQNQKPKNGICGTPDKHPDRTPGQTEPGPPTGQH